MRLGATAGRIAARNLGKTARINWRQSMFKETS